MRTIQSLALLATLALLAACSSSGDLGRGKTGKSFVAPGYSYDQVWAAALASVKETKGDQSLEVEKNLSITKEDKAAGVIEASTSISLWSWGEVVGVFITPAYDAPAYTIEVESLSKMKTNVFANNWEDEMIASIKKKLPAAQPY